MLKLLDGLTLISLACSTCDLCNSKNPVACHSERKYSLCINDQPTHRYIYCPLGYVCTNDAVICVNTADAVPSCPDANASNRCRICSIKNQIFSCLNETTIAFCFGNDKPNLEALAYCPKNTICDLENEKEFCSYADKAEPSCRETMPIDAEETTTTVATETDNPTTEQNTASPEFVIPRDPIAYCRDRKVSGSYKPDGDTTCLRFIFCYDIEGTWFGTFRDCPPNQYFDDVTHICIASKPDNCV